MESQATHLLHRHIFEPNFSLPRKASKFQSRLLLLNFKIPSSSQARDFSFPGFTASWANGARCIEARRFPSKSHLKLTLSLQCHKTVKRRTQFSKKHELYHKNLLMEIFHLSGHSFSNPFPSNLSIVFSPQKLSYQSA